MKRMFLSVWVMALCAMTSYAQQANIYASGLKAEKVDATHYKFSYTLNADAEGIGIRIFGGSYSATHSPQLSEYKTKGAHTIEIDLDDIPVGDYSWSVFVFANNTATEPVKISNDEPRFLFWGPRGLVVDSNFDSSCFGNIYVGESAGGTITEGAPSQTRTSEKGVYILNSALEDYTNQGATSYKGNVEWAGTYSPQRLAVAADGKIYIGDLGVENSGVWIMDPNSPSTDFVSVFDNTSKDVTTGLVGSIHGRICGLAVTGTGADTKLFTVDRNLLPADAAARAYLPSGYIYQYNIGDLESPWNTNPSAIVYNNSESLICNDALSLVSDNRGGWFVFINRGTDGQGGLHSLIHLNATGEVDYKSNSNLIGSPRGAMAISPDGSLMICGRGSGILSGGTSERAVDFYSITYNEAGAPSLTKQDHLTLTNIGSNIDGVALDVAGNAYIITASVERLMVYALPKADNSFTTPAPASQKVVIGGTGIQTPGAESLENRIRLIDGNENIRLLTDGTKIKAYTLYTVSGSKALQGTAAATTEVVIPTGSLSAGVYLLQLVTEEGTVVKRFIKH
jgi:hypothetical protein